MFYYFYQIFGALLWLVAVYGLLKKSKLNPVIGLDLAFLILLSGLIGGRLFHVFYEAPGLYLKDPLKIFRFDEGGFVFYGGLLSSLACSYLYLKIKKENFLIWADFFSPLVAVGYIYGRVGCFLVGCCYGSFCDLPWAVYEKHPTQIYSLLTELFLLLLLLSEKKQKRFSGYIFFLWLTGHGVGRIFTEPFRGDFRGEALYGFSVSSWISLGLILIGSFSLYILRNNKPPE